MKGTRATITLLFCVAVALGGACPLLAGPQKEGLVKYTAASIPKFKAAWFDRMEVGLRKAGADFGVNVSQKAPSPADVNQQASLIEDAINQNNDAILVVPDDPKSIESALARARAKKIVTITHQSPRQAYADYDIEMIDNTTFGQLAMEEMATEMGSPVGEYAVYVGSFTAADHNTWADAAIALARQKYPGLKLVGERFPVSEDLSLSRQTTLDVIAANPDIKAFLAFGRQGGPGIAQVLREKGLIGTVTNIGTTGPREASQYLKDGSFSASVVWDPAEAGYAMVFLARLVLDGKKSMIGPDLEIPGMGKPLSFAGNTFVYNRPIVLTKDNVDDYSGF